MCICRRKKPSRPPPLSKPKMPQGKNENSGKMENTQDSGPGSSRAEVASKTNVSTVLEKVLPKLRTDHTKSSRENTKTPVDSSKKKKKGFGTTSIATIQHPTQHINVPGPKKISAKRVLGPPKSVKDPEYKTLELDGSEWDSYKIITKDKEENKENKSKDDKTR